MVKYYTFTSNQYRIIQKKKKSNIHFLFELSLYKGRNPKHKQWELKKQTTIKRALNGTVIVRGRYDNANIGRKGGCCVGAGDKYPLQPPPEIFYSINISIWAFSILQSYTHSICVAQ